MQQDCCNIHTKKGKGVGQVSGYLRALNEPNRLKILCLLKQGERCVCDIFEPLGLPQNLVSHHLKALRDAGLIDYRKEGTKVIYFRDEKAIANFQKLLKDVMSV
ncbi:MAG: metalloregulator ArsR/SmtB family transcription factor [bacterium]|nr:metalloregulator ArsR/SmtB family transcription factor [bacterium]